jgi:amino acid transporter
MPGQTTVRPTLGLTGVTVNAMALIAPGAFLWITYQLQATATAPDGTSIASDIWAGIGFALVLAFLTALSYAQLARLYPEACVWTIVAFAERKERHMLNHFIVPALGLVANVAMLGAILYLYIIGNADAQHEAYICFGIAGAWALVSMVYVAVTSRRSGRAIVAAAPRAA